MTKALEWLFPVTLLAFIGPTVSYLSSVFTARERWIFLGLLAMRELFVRHRTVRNPGFVFLLFLYALWGITTSFWSEIYELSLYKSLLFFILVFTMMSAGQNWVIRQGAGRSLDFLTPIVVTAYGAAILGYFFSPIAFDGSFFQGFVYGSNMFGVLMAIITPFVLWRLYANWGAPRRRFVWLVCSFLALVFILMSQCRSALLIVISTLGGGMLAWPKRKQAAIVYLLLLCATMVYAVRPEIGSGIVKQVVYKDSDSIFHTRRQPWSESLEMASLGGWLGGGYGVSINSSSWQGGGFSVGGYGREKGSTQLAIVEETGIVGLIFYTMVIISMFHILMVRLRAITDKDAKVALGLFIGALAGMVLQSLFEAWWTAPGAPESAIFWALAGAALGLANTENGVGCQHQG